MMAWALFCHDFDLSKGINILSEKCPVVLDHYNSNEFTIGIEEDYGLFHGEMMNIAPVQWRNVIDVNKDPENIQFGLFNADYIKDACEISRIFANGRSANFHFIPSGLKTGAHIAFDYFDAEMIIMPIKRGHYGD